jgi:hypothetical protein
VPAGTGFTGFTGVNPAWLAGSADRERTVGVLRAAFTEGRLTQDELDDRVGRAYTARTYSALWALIADLPAGPLPYPNALLAPPYTHASPAVPPSAEPDTSWHSAAALVITALVIFTLAALVTAIATAHATPVPFQQGPLPPFQHAQLAPFITTTGGQPLPGLPQPPMPVRP